MNTHVTSALPILPGDGYKRTEEGAAAGVHPLQAWLLQLRRQWSRGGQGTAFSSTGSSLLVVLNVALSFLSLLSVF